MTETVKLQLKEIFSLVLQIECCQVSLTPSCDYVHVFRFPPKGSDYDIDVDGYWSDWCLPEHEKSLENCIKNLKKIIG